VENGAVGLVPPSGQWSLTGPELATGAYRGRCPDVGLSFCVVVSGIAAVAAQ
jgi:hypothetical protein